MSDKWDGLSELQTDEVFQLLGRVFETLAQGESNKALCLLGDTLNKMMDAVPRIDGDNESFWHKGFECRVEYEKPDYYKCTISGITNMTTYAVSTDAGINLCKTIANNLYYESEE